MVRVEQKPSFRRIYKKLHANQRQAVNKAIRAVLTDPGLGEEKRGDLNKVYVHKFDCVNEQYLLAYQLDNDCCTLLALGPHETFDRDLKR